MSVKDGRTAPFIWASVAALQHLREEWGEGAGVRPAVGRSVYYALCELGNEDRARTTVNVGSGQFRTSRKRICEQAGVSDKPVDKALRELERIGLVSIERGQTSGARPGASSAYALHEPGERCGASPHVEANEGAEKVRTSSGATPDVPAEPLRTPPHKEEEQKEEEEKQQGEIERLFALWQRETNRPTAKLTTGRRKALAARLAEYPAELIERAICNVAHSAFHQGNNESGRRHDDLTLICRNGEKLEGYAELVVPGAEPASPVDLELVREGLGELQEIWAKAQKSLQASVSESVYRIWLAPLSPLGMKGREVFLGVPKGNRSWVERRYGGLIVEALQATGVEGPELRFVPESGESTAAA